MFTSSIIAILTISRAIIQSCMGRSGLFAKGTEFSWISNYCISLMEIQSKLKTIMFTSCIIAILTTSKGHNPVMQGHIRLVFKRNQALINTKLLSKFGEDQIVNGASIVFKSSIMAILTNPVLHGLVCERNRALMNI